MQLEQDSIDPEEYQQFLYFRERMISGLIFPFAKIHNDSSEGLCMRGKIRTKEKCPVCGKKFENIGWTLVCKEHFTSPTRYYIDLYWKGKQRKIYSDNDGHVLKNYELADRVLCEIHQKIDKHRFDPLDYVAKNYQVLQFDNYASNWLKRYYDLYQKGEIAKTTWRMKRCYVEKLFIPAFKNKDSRSHDIRDIKTGDIDDFYVSLPDHLSLQTKKEIMKILHAIFMYGKRRRDIKDVPEFPKVVPPESKTV